MDNKMIDNEEQREDRKHLPDEDVKGEGTPRTFPNRQQRRMIAKRRGVFKRPGAWPYINTGAMKNKPNVKGDQRNDDQE